MTTKRIALYALVIIFSFGIDWATRQTPGYKARQATIKANEYHHEAIYIANIDQAEGQTDQRQDVRFTSFWPEESSGNKTASGLGIEDFGLNAQGWFTYQDKVVVASATEECLESNAGACRKYSKLPDGYQLHRLFDELTLLVDGVEYPAIILDHCGASFWDEQQQRYDIYVVDEDHLIDGPGQVVIDP
ncbi:MAG: hypothetical protein ACLTJB_04310 [Holdemania filiformis]